MTAEIQRLVKSMRQGNLIILLVILVVYGCQTDKGKILQEETVIEPFPVVLDTIGHAKFQFDFDEVEHTWLTTGNYQPCYIGLKRDTIYLQPYIQSKPSPPPSLLSRQNEQVEFKERKNPIEKHIMGWLDERVYIYWEQTKMEIRVDTSVNIYNSHPVLITNIDVDTIFIGFGEQIPIIMEALDSAGVWKPIQEENRHKCGIGLNFIILPPKECALTLAPIFKGDFKTMLRLNFGEKHSNAFIGFINYRQFESKYNKYGDYKYEYTQELQKSNR